MICHSGTNAKVILSVLSLKNGDKADVSNWLPFDFSNILTKLNPSVPAESFAN